MGPNSSIGVNGSNGPKFHQINLKRVIIEKHAQPFTQIAMLTLKDGGFPFNSFPARTYTGAPAAPTATYKRLMQIHIDGNTLAEWDLTLLTERDFAERGVFYGFAEGKMLRLRLPPTIVTPKTQLENPFKTVQLYINTHQDFHTAVSYLSKDVGLQQNNRNENIDSPLTSGGQTPGFAPATRDIATQASAALVVQDATTQASVKAQDIAVQTEEALNTSKDVEMRDSTTNTFTTYVDAAVETAKCADLWLPLSRSLELVSWAQDRRNEQLKKAEDVLRTTDPSRGDHRDKVYLAAQYGLEFEIELRKMCEKVLQDSF
ncbi:hypothetical protein VMCG_05704 [Cytospora schulzeri]|uniref:Uncharacterized protein n=1 Tax=Cytospora schulzeri TaxID=448051 RepID=A0A423WI35_9PEZI|nr:hypothetical protein VMCG_05704 [Valsa malicola]